jgi:hypothetical protein
MVGNGTLVAPDQAATGFPRIPNVAYNGGVNGLRVVDYSVQPPREGASYPVLVPKVDADGHDVAGIRMPSVEAPVATYLGWNLRRAGFAEGALCSVTGSTIPLAETRAERGASRDPRLSIEERYATHADYVEQVSEAVERLVSERLYLEEDAERVLVDARRSGVGEPSP